jgi:hypothetical protein
MQILINFLEYLVGFLHRFAIAYILTKQKFTCFYKFMQKSLINY